MIWPDMIPDEVVKAARQAWLGSDVNAMEDWRAAIAAALNAWPGNTMESREVLNFGNNIDGPVVSTNRVQFFILPLETRAAGVLPPQKDQPNE